MEMFAVGPTALQSLSGTKTVRVLLDLSNLEIRGHRRDLAKMLALTCKGVGGAAAIQWIEQTVCKDTHFTKVTQHAVIIAAIAGEFGTQHDVVAAAESRSTCWTAFKTCKKQFKNSDSKCRAAFD